METKAKKTKNVENDKKYWLAWTKVKNIGLKKIVRIYEYFGDMGTAWQASTDEIARAGIEINILESLNGERNDINPDELLENATRENIHILTWADENYPEKLRQIYDAPVVLYYRGRLQKEESAIAIVGTRKFTNYGEQITRRITEVVSDNDITTVSGLALGVDTIVHETTVKRGKRTIAVLGSGIDERSIYPMSNRRLAEEIVENDGLILSEYEAGIKPTKYSFPERNRIVSGLSMATIVTEAPAKSGSLLTAKIALEQNREVMTVPGSVFSRMSEGTNALIKDGAQILTKTDDIFEYLHIEKDLAKKKSQIKADNDDEKAVLDILSYKPTHINEIIKQTEMSASKANGLLLMMEMKGKVKNVGNMGYVLG